MSTNTTNTDPVAAASDQAWSGYATGTYSVSDKRIFEQGFRNGWRARHVHSIRQLPQSYTSVTVSCWLCRGEHYAGIKFCPVLTRIF